MEKRNTQDSNVSVVTFLAIFALVMLVIFASIPPLSGHLPGQGGFGGASTWISLLLVFAAFLIPYFMMQNGSENGKKLLAVVFGITTVLIAACIIFSFLMLSEYDPKGLIFGVVLAGFVFIILSIIWFNIAFRAEGTTEVPPFTTAAGNHVSAAQDASVSFSDPSRMRTAEFNEVPKRNADPHEMPYQRKNAPQLDDGVPENESPINGEYKLLGDKAGDPHKDPAE